LKQGLYVTDVAQLWVTTYVEVKDSRLGDFAQGLIDALPTPFENNGQLYFDAIRKIGTHYIQNASIGGMTRGIFRTTHDYNPNTYPMCQTPPVGCDCGNDDCLKEGWYSLDAMTNVKMMEYLDTHKRRKRRSGAEIKKSYDENTTPLYKQYYPPQTWIINCQLMPISNLISDNKKAAEMEKAVTEYIKNPDNNFQSDGKNSPGDGSLLIEMSSKEQHSSKSESHGDDDGVGSDDQYYTVGQRQHLGAMSQATKIMTEPVLIATIFRYL